MTTDSPDSGPFVLDYGLLHDAANELKALGPDIDRMKDTGWHRSGMSWAITLPTLTGSIESTTTTVGNGDFGYSLGHFCDAWSGPMSDGADQIKKLEEIFRGTANAFMEGDAAQAAAINEGAAMSTILGYPAEMKQYYKEVADWWHNLAYNQVHPGAVKPGSLPQPPAAPTSPFSLVPGLSTTFDQGTADPNAPKDYPVPLDLPTTETTTVNSGGMTYSETTTFGPDKGWAHGGPTQDTTQVVTNPDGSKDTITTTMNTDGSGTKTVQQSDGTTTTSTTTDWGKTWVDQPVDQPVVDNTLPAPNY
jgi:hypothetical protein